MQHVKWPELVISSGDKKSRDTIRRAVKAGLLRPIASKIYSSNFKDSPEEIIKRHRYQILKSFFPQAVISHRSAFDGGISREGIVVLTYKYTKTIKIPGLTVRLFKGPSPDAEDTPFLENLYISSRGRTFLENLSQSRQRGERIKNVSLQVIEERLDRMARIYGVEELNVLRDQARRVASRLKWEREFALLDKLIGSFLGTKMGCEPVSVIGRARAEGVPFDPQRVELFAVLSLFLQQMDFPPCPRITLSSQAMINESFFESYFSNYIEGTIFDIKEAEQIIFEHKIFSSRPEDSHDILSTFQIVSNKEIMGQVPTSGLELMAILKQRHALLMEVRDSVMPGRFKESLNRVGNTIFVKPEEVQGTLLKGFEFYSRLPLGMARAAFIMFLILEIHPFIDGNGRVARILMNAELDVVNQSRVIIPTVFREDYLLALRKLSRTLDPAPYVKMLLLAQAFTVAISYENYDQALLQLQACNAFMESNEGKLILP